MDDCFGDVQKLPTKCSDAARSLVNRFAPTNSPTQILITESANLVSKYDLEDLRHSVDSWSFDELNKLLIPMVVYYPETGKMNVPQETLIGLHTGNTIIEWVPSESRELRQKQRRKIKNVIIAIVSFGDNTSFEPIIIFSNGHAELYEDMKDNWNENSIKPVLGPNEELVAIKHFSESNMTAKLYYITLNKSTSQKTIYKLTVFSNRAPTQTIITPLTIDIERFTFSKALGGFIGSMKKEDKIYFYSLEPAEKGGSAAQSSSPLFTLEVEVSDKVCSIASCSKGAIVVLSEVAENSETLFQVQVFETKYGMKIGELGLSEAVYANDFTVVHDSVLITCKNNIVLAPIHKQTVRLAELMHKNFSEEEKRANFSAKFKALVGVGEHEQLRHINSLQRINKTFSTLVRGILNKRSSEDLPEELIVSLFNFCTRNYLEISGDAGEVAHRENLLEQYKLFFGHLAKVPYNEAFLVSCLKKSSITMAQYLLAIDWLLALMPYTDISPISWISSLLDANYRQFVVKPSAEVKAALKRVAENVNRSIHFYEDLGPIKTLFEAISNADSTVASLLTPSETNIGFYSIELLSFT